MNALMDLINAAEEAAQKELVDLVQRTNLFRDVIVSLAADVEKRGRMLAEAREVINGLLDGMSHIGTVDDCRHCKAYNRAKKYLEASWRAR